MNREELETYIPKTYNAKQDFPWVKYPTYEVFRHADSKKWFALIMNLPKEKLGIAGVGTLDVINLKCAPDLIGSLRIEKGFFPAYHMNKEHWITAVLDGSVPDDKIKMLLDMSYKLTAPKQNRKI